MSSETAFTPEEIAELRKLLEIEKIRKVRVLYTQLMDGRAVDALVDLLTENAVCEFGPFGVWHGRGEIRSRWREVFRDGVPFGGLHFNTNMWIELTGATTASSRSYLQSVHNDAGPRTNPVAVYGLYDEDYVKLDGAWKISRCRLPFLWPKRVVGDDFPRPLVPSALG